MRLIFIFFLTLVLGIFIGIGIEPNIRSELRHSHLWKAPSAPVQAAITPTSKAKTVKVPLASPEDKDLANLLHEPNALQRTRDLLDYVDSVPVGSLGAEVDRVARLSGSGRDTALELLVARWTKEDLDSARKAMLTVQDEYARHLLVTDIFGSLAMNDVADAMKQAQQLPSEDLRSLAIQGVVEQVAQADPVQAMSLLSKTDPRKDWMVRSIFSDWAVRDPSQATQAALNLPLATQRRDAVIGITIALAQRDPKSTLDWVDQLPRGSIQDTARADALLVIGSSTPKVAADYFSNLHILPENMRQAAIRVADSYAGLDPVAATSWAATLAPGDTRRTALETTLGDWMAIDPDNALRYYDSLGASVGFDRPGLDTLASSWATNNPSAALQWAQDLPVGGAKDGALEAAVSEWAKNDPAKAATYVQTMAAGSLQMKMIAEVASAWAEEDPAGTSLWLANLPTTAATPDMYGNLSKAWAGNDPAGASAWLQNLPQGPNRDMASASFSSQVVSSDPPGALACAESIRDPKLQQSSVLAVLQKWQASDPDSAAAAASTAPLTQEQKSKFTSGR